MNDKGYWNLVSLVAEFTLQGKHDLASTVEEMATKLCGYTIRVQDVIQKMRELKQKTQPAAPVVTVVEDGPDVDEYWFNSLFKNADLHTVLHGSAEWMAGWLEDPEQDGPEWFYQEHDGMRFGDWKAIACPTEARARELFNKNTAKRKRGGFRVMAPDGEIVAEVWKGWRCKKHGDPPPIALQDEPQERVAGD